MDSETTGPKAPVKEVVDNGIESEVVVGLPGKFQEGDMNRKIGRWRWMLKGKENQLSWQHLAAIGGRITVYYSSRVTVHRKKNKNFALLFMASDGSDPDAEYALSRLLQRGEFFSLARIAEARFADQGPATMSATPTFPIGGSPNKASDSSTTPEVSSEAVREATTAVGTVAKIEETDEFYTSEYEEHGMKPEKVKSNDDGFKWGVQELSAFEELKQRISTTSVLSLPDFNEDFRADLLEKPMAICDSKVVFFKTAMQRRLWDPKIKIYFRHHLADKVVVKEWGMIRPRFR
ncbi:hypothetical protein Tco_1406786 [Tanacetum coccineum]